MNTKETCNFKEFVSVDAFFKKKVNLVGKIDFVLRCRSCLPKKA